MTVAWTVANGLDTWPFAWRIFEAMRRASCGGDYGYCDLSVWYDVKSMRVMVRHGDSPESVRWVTWHELVEVADLDGFLSDRFGAWSREIHAYESAGVPAS